MSIHKIQESNALLLYKVGPVFVCSPTMPVEAVVMPPKLTVPPGASVAEPGVFKSLHGLVRLVDLRVRFGVDEDDFTTPGRIVIVEVEGGHAGFWVDEIEDVVGFPDSGWSQVPAYIPRNVFSRTLIEKENIRLYADFEQLDKLKTSGYLRKHIEMIKKAEAEKIAEVISSEYQKPAVIYSTEKSAEINTEVKQKVEVDGIYKSGVSPVSKKIEENKLRSGASALASANKVQYQKNKIKKSYDIKEKDLFVDDKSKLEANAEKTAKYEKTESLSGNEKINAETSEKYTPSKPESNINKYNENEFKKVAVSRSSDIEDSGGNEILWGVVTIILFIGIAYLLFDAFDSEDADKKNDTFIKNNTHEVTKRFDLNKKIKDSSIIKYDEVVGLNERAAMPSDSARNESVEISKNENGVLIVINEYDEAGLVDSDGLDDQAAPEIEVEKNTGEFLSDDLSEFNDRKELEEVDNNKLNELYEAKSLFVENELVEHALEEKASKRQLIKEEKSDSKKEVLSVKISEEKIVSNENPVPLTKKYIHVVVKGDTLWFIAKKYVNNPWRYPELARLSHIKNPDLIYPGDRVTIIINFKTN